MSMSRKSASRGVLARTPKSSIEDLKVQVSAADIPHQLQPTKSILLAILETVRPNSNGIGKTVSAFIKRLVDLSMNIFTLVETELREPHIILEEFNQVLRDAKSFVILANRCMAYPCSRTPTTLEKAINMRCRAIDQLLVSIISILEATTSSEDLTSATSSIQPIINASSNLFSGANDFTINHSQVYSAPGGSISIYMETPNRPQGVALNSGHGGLSDFYQDDEPELEKELHKGEGYRGRSRDKAVVVKVFQGPRAKQLCLKTAEFNRDILHPNVIRMIEGPNRNSGSSFIVFNGDFQETIESQLAKALTDGVQDSCVMGANTVIGCSLGLDYLHESGLPFPLMGPEHFVLMVAKDGRIVVNFDADATWEAVNNNESDHLSLVQVEKAKEVCHELIRKTFYTACKEYYQNQRFYDESDEILLDNTNNLPEPGEESEQPFPRPEGGEQQSLKRNSLHKTKGHRRELIWKSKTKSSASLAVIGQKYQSSLARLRSESVLVHRQGYSTRKVVHRCPGYKRTEIILTPDFEQSGIVSHSSPLPDEICSVCRQKVEKAQVIYSGGRRRAESSTSVELGARPTIGGHDLMAMFPQALPTTSQRYVQRQERPFFAQAGKEIRVRVGVDLPYRAEPEPPSSSSAPHHSPIQLSSAPVLYPNPSTRPSQRGTISVTRAPQYFAPGSSHTPLMAQSHPPPSLHQSGSGMRTPPQDSLASGPPSSKPDYPSEEYDPDEAWRRPMPYAEIRRAGKHTRRVIVRT